MEKTAYYCKKCNSIPLIQIVPKEKEIEIFCMCKCNKKLINYDIFMNNYFKTNFDYSKISDNNIYKEYIERDPLYKKDNKKINLEKIDNDFNYITQKINEYNLELKNGIISLLNNKISEIEKIYNQNQRNNIKLQNIIKTLISNYKSNTKNASNIKNLQYNTNFNLGYKNDTYNKLNFKDSSINLEYLVKNVSNYLKSNYILSSYNEQIDTIKTFYSQSKEVTSIIEIKPEILAASSLDNYIILFNLERKKSIYRFYAHNNGVYNLLKINENHFFSCGGDNKINIWPKIEDKNLELVNSVKNTTSSTVQINIVPIKSYQFEEQILNMIKLDMDSLCVYSQNNIYLIKYEFVMDNYSENNNKNLKDININIKEKIMLDHIKDLIGIKNKNLIIAYCSFVLRFLSFPELKLIKEINIVDNSQKPRLAQLNENEILLVCQSSIRLININKFQIKLKIQYSDKISCLHKLNDDTFLIGTKYGIKRMNLKYSEDISLINKIYNTLDYFHNIQNPNELFTYIYEFNDGRLAICSSYGNIKICKFKLA